MQGYFIILQKTDRQQSELIYECPSQNLAESFNYIVETYSEIIWNRKFLTPLSANVVHAQHVVFLFNCHTFFQISFLYCQNIGSEFWRQKKQHSTHLVFLCLINMFNSQWHNAISCMPDIGSWSDTFWKRLANKRIFLKTHRHLQG